MKRNQFFSVLKPLFILTLFLKGFSAPAQNSNKDQRLIADSREAKADFIRTDALMKNLFSNSYGYVIFPNVGKGAIGIGGGAGFGIVREIGKIIGRGEMNQVTLVFSSGGHGFQPVAFS